MATTSDQGALLYQLTNGREMAKRLKSHNSSPEVCEALVESILSTYDKALEMLSWKMAIKEEAAASPESGIVAFSGSPSSEITSLSPPKDVSKKRKMSTKWSHQVRVCSKGQDGNSLDDGHSWRKYGQKDILGATYPRAYYRCTHRISRGCLATKQVQRADADSSVLEITYKGNHTCSQTATNANSMIAPDQTQTQPQLQMLQNLTQTQTQPQLQMLQNLTQTQTLKVETEHIHLPIINYTQEEEIFPSFSFPPFAELEPENQDSHHALFPDSPTTSDSYYYSSDLGNILLNSQYCETTPTSVMDSPFCDLDFLVDQEPTFALDALPFF